MKFVLSILLGAAAFTNAETITENGQCDPLAGYKALYLDRHVATCENGPLNSLHFTRDCPAADDMRITYSCNIDSNLKTEYFFDEKTDCSGSRDDTLEFVQNHLIDCHTKAGFIQSTQFDRDWSAIGSMHQGCFSWVPIGSADYRGGFFGCVDAAKAANKDSFIFGNTDSNKDGDCYLFSVVPSSLQSAPRSDGYCSTYSYNDGYGSTIKLGNLGHFYSAFTMSYDTCFDGMTNRYTCREGFPTSCTIKYTDCEPWTGVNMEFLDRHNMFCPAGQSISQIKPWQVNGNGTPQCSDPNDGKFMYFCCDTVVESRLQQEANHWCRENTGKPLARRDFGNSSQQTAAWRCYDKLELVPHMNGTLNCVDDCNNLIDCGGQVYQGLSIQHSSKTSQIEAFLAANSPTYCTSAPTAEPTAEPTPEPTAEPTPEPTAEPTAEPTYEEGSQARDIQIAAAEAGLACQDVTVNVHHFWQNVDNKAHVEDPGTGVYEFSVMGGAKASVNIGLADKNDADGQFSGVDVFIGSDDEPVIHISEELDTAPVAFASIAEDKIFQADSFTHVWLKVDGNTISVGKGKYDESTSSAILSHTLSSSKVMNEAVFTYGYGDYQCELM